MGGGEDSRRLLVVGGILNNRTRGIFQATPSVADASFRRRSDSGNALNEKVVYANRVTGWIFP